MGPRIFRREEYFYTRNSNNTYKNRLPTTVKILKHSPNSYTTLNENNYRLKYILTKFKVMRLLDLKHEQFLKIVTCRILVNIVYTFKNSICIYIIIHINLNQYKS